MVSGLLGGIAGGASVAITIKAIDEFSKVFNNANSSLGDMSKFATLAGTAITGMGIAGAVAIGGLLKVAGDFEQTQIAFSTMLGSEEAAMAKLKELTDFAVRTPFTITGIEQNAKQLLAMGVTSEKLLPTLKSLGDLSSGLNVPLNRLALNFGQVRTQGKLTGRELRDFAVAGVPLVAELAKNLGVAEKQIAEMVSAGDIGFDQVEEAFTTMTSEGGKFFDLMDKQSATFLGKISNIQDSLIKLARIMGEVLLPAATWVADKLQVLIGWLEQHPTVAKFATILLAVGTGLALIVGPMLIIVGAFGALIAAMPLIIGGFGALSAVTAPITATILAIVLAVGLLVVAGYYMVKHWDKIKDTFSTIWNTIVGVAKASINIIIAGINLLLKALNFVTSKLGLGKFELLEKLSLDNEVKAIDSNQGSSNVINISIDKVQGTDPDDMSEALQRELNNVISLN